MTQKVKMKVEKILKKSADSIPQKDKKNFRRNIMTNI
jgi:hypothetical protein